MKFRSDKVSDQQEREVVEAVRALSALGGGESSPAPPAHYWSNMIVRVNNRVDELTSGKALSISWALRVALPGVVAIVSFLIGLHYYVPEETGTALTTVVYDLSEEMLDSMLVLSSTDDEPADAILYADPFEVSGAEISEYLISTGRIAGLIDALSDDQVGELLASLDSYTN